MDELTKHARLFNMKNELSCLSLDSGKSHMYFSYGIPIGLCNDTVRHIVEGLGAEHKRNVQEIMNMYDNERIVFININSFLKILG